MDYSQKKLRASVQISAVCVYVKTHLQVVDDFCNKIIKNVMEPSATFTDARGGKMLLRENKPKKESRKGYTQRNCQKKLP